MHERELIKSKRTFMNMFYAFLADLNLFNKIDLKAFMECVEGLRGIISIQLRNNKNKELQIILKGELASIKGIVELINDDYKRNKGAISRYWGLLKRDYDKERRLW